jgi:hypothetical protein
MLHGVFLTTLKAENLGIGFLLPASVNIRPSSKSFGLGFLCVLRVFAAKGFGVPFSPNAQHSGLPAAAVWLVASFISLTQLLHWSRLLQLFNPLLHAQSTLIQLNLTSRDSKHSGLRYPIFHHLRKASECLTRYSYNLVSNWMINLAVAGTLHLQT